MLNAAVEKALTRRYTPLPHKFRARPSMRFYSKGARKVPSAVAVSQSLVLAEGAADGIFWTSNVSRTKPGCESTIVLRIALTITLRAY